MALYQGTASAVPTVVSMLLGFSPCVWRAQRLKPIPLPRACGTAKAVPWSLDISDWTKALLKSA